MTTYVLATHVDRAIHPEWSGSADSRCAFCRIVAKQSRAYVVYEDEDVIAFLGTSLQQHHLCFQLSLSPGCSEEDKARESDAREGRLADVKELLTSSSFLSLPYDRTSQILCLYDPAIPSSSPSPSPAAHSFTICPYRNANPARSRFASFSFPSVLARSYD
jgi:hypothetical protein